MQKRSCLGVVFVLVIMLLAACGGGDGDQSSSTGGAGASATAAGGPATGSAAAGTADNGKAIFTAMTQGSNPGCATCHSLDGSQLVGPTMQGIGARASTRVQGQSAQEYLHASIVDPNAHVVEGFVQGVMPSYKDTLTEADLNDLVAYLLSLK